MKRETEFRYSKLANILREQIMSGYIKPGHFLMSENDLCKHYGMSRTSVRKSLDQLMKEGLIVKKVGQGTIVSPDLVIEPPQHKVLRIFATSPSNYFDHCMPMIIEEFEREHPNVEVKCLSFSSNEFWDSVQASIELGLQPDVILTSDRYFSDAQSSAYEFVDLKEHLHECYDMLYPRLREPFLKDNQLKGAIVTFSTVFLAYNPTLFQRYNVPEPSELWSTEEFLEAAKRLTMDTNGDGIDDLYGITLSSSLNRWPVIALQNGADFKPTSGKEALVKTLTFMHDLLYRHRVATLSPRYVLNSDSFAKGKAAMMVSTSIEMAGWRNSFNFKAKIASLPFGEHMSTMLIANALMVPAASHETELAIRFVQKAMSPEMQERLGRETGFMSALRPINEKTMERSLLQSLYMNEETMRHSYFLHELFGDFSLVDDIENEMQLYWAGLESADEVAERLLSILVQK